MKTKSLFLGALALILAVGTAFASRALSADIFTEVYLTPQAETNHSASCLNTHVTCEDVSGSQCRVRLDVQKADAGDVTSETFRDDICSQQITQSGSAIAESTEEVWSLVSPE